MVGVVTHKAGAPGCIVCYVQILFNFCMSSPSVTVVPTSLIARIELRVSLEFANF